MSACEEDLNNIKLERKEKCRKIIDWHLYLRYSPMEIVASTWCFSWLSDCFSFSNENYKPGYGDRLKKMTWSVNLCYLLRLVFEPPSAKPSGERLNALSSCKVLSSCWRPSVRGIRLGDGRTEQQRSGHKVFNQPESKKTTKKNTPSVSCTTPKYSPSIACILSGNAAESKPTDWDCKQVKQDRL